MTPEHFIHIWQNSDSVDEVAQKTGYDKNNLYKRAQYYRNKGIELKKFRESPDNNNWVELNKNATSYRLKKAACPKCGGTEFEHVNKRDTEEGPIYRQRVCKGCGCLFATYELSVEDFNMLLGKQGTGENLLHILWKRSERGNKKIREENEKETHITKPVPAIKQ